MSDDVRSAYLSEEADASTKPLTRQQARFVDEYIVDLNATRAAIRAGYSPKTAQSQASVLLSIPAIAASVESAVELRRARIATTQDDVIHEVSALALSRIDHYLVDDAGQVQLAEGAPLNAMAAIESIDRRTTVNKDGSIVYAVKIKLHDKPGQLKLLGRHIGLFPDKVELHGKNGGPIEVVTRIEQVIVDPKEVGK